MLIRIAHLLTRHAVIVVAAVAAIVGASAAIWDWTAEIQHQSEGARHSLFRKSPSGQLIIVEIDGRSVEELQSWPWPRNVHGRLVDRLREAGARQIAFDVLFGLPSPDRSQDAAFAAAIERARGRVILPALLENADGEFGERVEILPPPLLRAHARVGSIWIMLDPDLIARRIPYAVEIGGARRPSIATELAGRSERHGMIEIDWSYVWRDFPHISYADVLAGRFPPGFFDGKDVLVGATSTTLGDRYTVPSHGRLPGVFIQAIAAETLRNGAPQPVGAWPALIAALLLIALCAMMRSPFYRNGGLAMVTLGSVAGPLLLREFGPYVADPGPAFAASFAALVVGIALSAAASFLERAMRTSSHLPNLTAMVISAPASAITVAVRLRNHLEITALLGPDLQGELLRKVFDRLTLAASDAAVFQVDDHSFAWRTTGTLSATTDAIEGLHALFASGIAVDDRTVDVTISVGISDGASLDVESAVTAAMAAASRAERRGLNWERYEADDGDDANWRLSLLNELDRAIDHGDVWVAYQPKYDLVSGTMCGAEALVRWSHALRGEIRPDQFIPTLEENGRIEKLTLHVLDTALRDFSTLDPSLSIAINISARMIGRNRLLDPIAEMLARHRVDAERLTLEVTESAALAGSAGIEELNNLRALGVHISIDDYGTGQSTLSYLKTLPATELKIDRSFVGLIASSRSDAAVVDSTVKLAHALGLTVVAEGVETEEVLALLKQMNCDMIQGYLVGEPARFEQFVKRLSTRRTIRVG